MSSFENLTISRIIVHEVVLSSVLEQGREPVMSQALAPMDENGRILVARRLADALGTESHSIEVDIEEEDEGSAFQLATALLDVSDEQFVTLSRALAIKLSKAQTIGSIKSGVAVVIQAEAGPTASRHRLAVIIKAESDSAFVKRNVNEGVLLEFVKEMVFGAQQKLFKIAALAEMKSGTCPRRAREFEVLVYDHQMNIKGEGTAAQYFYARFLGATMVASTPQLNKRFFDATSEFISRSNRTREEKWALRGDLISYFRSREGMISGRDFADRYIPDVAERRAYASALRDADVPNRNIEKDTRFFANQLKQRRLTFSNRVNLTAPAEGFSQAVQIIETTPDSTTIKIAGTVMGDS